MFVLIVMLVMTQEIYSFGPGGETVLFPTEAACEAQLAKVLPRLTDVQVPFVAVCVTKEKFEDLTK